MADAPEPSASCATNAPNGFFSQCLDISTNATDYGYVKLPGTDSASLAYPDNKTFSATVWVKAGNLTGDPVVFGNKNWSSGKNKGVALVVKNNTTFRANTGTGVSSTTRTDIDLEDREGNTIWTFYAVVCTSDALTFYKGTSASTNTFVKGTAANPYVTMASGYPFYIGTDGTGAYKKQFVGCVDDFALWNRELSEDEVLRIYEAGRSGMELGDLLKIDALDEAPEVSVASADNDSVTLSFGGRRSSTLGLYVGYGTTDCREDKRRWDYFAKVADIAASDTSYVYTVPDALKAINAKFRFFLMQTDDLPYAKELEYIHSDGTAWIDTGVAARRHLIAEFDTCMTAQNGNYDNFFGAFSVDGNKASNYGLSRYMVNASHTYYRQWMREYCNQVSTPSQFCGQCLENTDYHIVFSTTNFIVNGTAYGSAIEATSFLEGGVCINLFRNVKLLSGATVATRYDNALIGRIGHFSLRTPEMESRSFWPAEDSEGNLGMFDAVTGEFYASGGTAFTGGNEVTERVGWVRSVSAPLETFAGTTPATAIYTGAGTDPYDFTDGANWQCWNIAGELLDSNTVPTEETAVTVSGTTTFAVPSGTAMFSCRSLTLAATLAADADWSGLDLSLVASGSTLDLAGYDLTLAATETTTTFPAFAVTNSLDGAANLGTVTLSVASGRTLDIGDATLSGNLQVVKTGAGTYIPSRASQTYTGGTDLTAGTIQLAEAISGHLGTGTLRVGPDGTFDLYSYNALALDLVFAGGVITSTKANTSKINLPTNAVLTADSYITMSSSNEKHDFKLSPGSVWNLGGHVLTATFGGSDPDFDLQEVTVSNGTLRAATISSAAWLQLWGLDGKDGLTLDIANTVPRLHTGVNRVWNFRADDPVNNLAVFSQVGYALEVYGTYTPSPSSCGFSVKMMNGSTVNLTEKTGVWACLIANPCGFTSGSDKAPCMSFEDGAAVTVDISGRDDLAALAASESPYVMTWATNAVPAATVAFSPDAATATAANWILRRDDTGLRIKRRSGMILSFR